MRRRIDQLEPVGKFIQPIDRIIVPVFARGLPSEFAEFRFYKDVEPIYLGIVGRSFLNKGVGFRDLDIVLPDVEISGMKQVAGVGVPPPFPVDHMPELLLMELSREEIHFPEQLARHAVSVRALGDILVDAQVDHMDLALFIPFPRAPEGDIGYRPGHGAFVIIRQNPVDSIVMVAADIDTGPLLVRRLDPLDHQTFTFVFRAKGHGQRQGRHQQKTKHDFERLHVRLPS